MCATSKRFIKKSVSFADFVGATGTAAAAAAASHNDIHFTTDGN